MIFRSTAYNMGKAIAFLVLLLRHHWPPIAQPKLYSVYTTKQTWSKCIDTTCAL